MEEYIIEFYCTEYGFEPARVLYFFMVGKRIILTNGFVKKTQKTPKREIEKAIKFMNDYKRRQGL